MFNEFVKNTQRFRVKKPLESVCSDEAIVKFSNRKEIQTFFDNAMKNRINCASINRIARDVAPSYCCRPQKNRPMMTDAGFLEILFSEIDRGNATVVLKNDCFKTNQKENGLAKEGGNNLSEEFDIIKFAEKQVNHLKEIYAKMVHTDYSFLEKVIREPEDSRPGSRLVTIDTSSIQDHSTGWKDWDNPIEYSSFGALKALVVFNLAKAAQLSESAFLAAAAGYISEGVKCQYNMTGKSINCRQWYGTYCIRFNLKKWDYEVAWVKYKKSGPDERLLIELKRSDRIVKDNKVIFTANPSLIKPLTTMEDFLSNYRNGFVPPEHDIHTPIRLNKGLLGL